MAVRIRSSPARLERVRELSALRLSWLCTPAVASPARARAAGVSSSGVSGSAPGSCRGVGESPGDGGGWCRVRPGRPKYRVVRHYICSVSTTFGCWFLAFCGNGLGEVGERETDIMRIGVVRCNVMRLRSTRRCRLTTGLRPIAPRLIHRSRASGTRFYAIRGRPRAEKDWALLARAFGIRVLSCRPQPHRRKLRPDATGISLTDRGRLRRRCLIGLPQTGNGDRSHGLTAGSLPHRARHFIAVDLRHVAVE